MVPALILLEGGCGELYHKIRSSIKEELEARKIIEEYHRKTGA